MGSWKEGANWFAVHPPPRSDNPALFYRLLLAHTEFILPFVYTPTVGEACQRCAQRWAASRGGRGQRSRCAGEPSAHQPGRQPPCPCFNHTLSLF